MSITTISPICPDDIDDVVRAHIALQHTSYAHLADPGHAAALWGSSSERTAALRANLDAAASAGSAGREPDSIDLVARGERGAVVGLASAFCGVGDWERHLFGAEHVPATASWCLDTLYVMPGLRGAGLGQRLLDAVLPDRRDAYLWVIDGNPGAIRFYQRNGFRLDGFGGRSGPEWGDLMLRRMVRDGNAG